MSRHVFNRRGRAAYRVTAGLVEARSDLDIGRVANARARLESIQADLDQLDDAHCRRDLTALHRNLLDTARATPEGVPVLTDADGLPTTPGEDELPNTAA